MSWSEFLGSSRMWDAQPDCLQCFGCDVRVQRGKPWPSSEQSRAPRLTGSGGQRVTFIYTELLHLFCCEKNVEWSSLISTSFEKNPHYLFTSYLKYRHQRPDCWEDRISCPMQHSWRHSLPLWGFVSVTHPWLLSPSTWQCHIHQEPRVTRWEGSVFWVGCSSHLCCVTRAWEMNSPDLTGQEPRCPCFHRAGWHSLPSPCCVFLGMSLNPGTVCRRLGCVVLDAQREQMSLASVPAAFTTLWPRRPEADTAGVHAEFQIADKARGRGWGALRGTVGCRWVGVRGRAPEEAAGAGEYSRWAGLGGSRRRQEAGVRCARATPSLPPHWLSHTQELAVCA